MKEKILKRIRELEAELNLANGDRDFVLFNQGRSAAFKEVYQLFQEIEKEKELKAKEEAEEDDKRIKQAEKNKKKLKVEAHNSKVAS